MNVDIFNETKEKHFKARDFVNKFIIFLWKGEKLNPNIYTSILIKDICNRKNILLTESGNTMIDEFH